MSNTGQNTRKDNKRGVFIATVGGGFEHPKVIGRHKVGKTVVKVAEVKRKVKYGYIGGNMEAMKQLGIPCNLPYNEIVHWAGSPKKIKQHTDHHEEIERHAVRYGHLGRVKSHLLANTWEAFPKITPANALHWYKSHKRLLYSPDGYILAVKKH